MVLLSAMIGGAVAAWYARRAGLFACWTAFLNVVLSIYLGIFLAPTIIPTCATGVGVGFAPAVSVFGAGLTAFAATYGLCRTCLSGCLRLELTKICDAALAPALGFLTGFLTVSFFTFVACLTPWSQSAAFQTVGLDAKSQPFNISFIAWWCDTIHDFAGSSENWQTTRETMTKLLQSPSAPAGRGAITQTTRTLPPQAPQPRHQTHTRPPAKADAKPGVSSPQGSRPNPSESLEQEMARRRVLIADPANIVSVVANREVLIMELADHCTLDKFDAKQAKLLQAWVYSGGVLWTNNNVLRLFGIQYSKLVWWGGDLECNTTMAGDVSSLLARCKRIILRDAGGKAHGLLANGVRHLVTLEKDIPFEAKAGTASWSIVPFGKGWISNPKAVKLSDEDGEAFWRQFCLLCLRKEFKSQRQMPNVPQQLMPSK